VNKIYVPSIGLSPDKTYQMVASFNGAEGFEVKIDPIDLRPAAFIHGI